MHRNLLTNESGMFYTESLKTVIPAFAPVRFAIFLYLPMARTRAENNQYQPSLYYSFSESLPLSYLVALSKKVIQMTNTIIEKISEVRYILDALYTNTDSQQLAMHCSVIRKDLADLIIEILDEQQLAAE